MRVYPLPSGRAHYEGLKSAFVDFPRLLRTLRSDRHTGYVNLSGSGYSGVILLNDGQALQALCSNGTAVQGESAFLQIRRHMDAGDGVIDVIELDGETVTALAQLFTSPYLFSGLLGRFVNLDALLEYLAEEKVSGSVVVQTPTEAGIILLRDGDILGTYTESQRSLDKATTAVAALATDRQSSHRGQGWRRDHRRHRRRRRAQPRVLAPLPRASSRAGAASGGAVGGGRADRAPRSPGVSPAHRRSSS